MVSFILQEKTGVIPLMSLASYMLSRIPGRKGILDWKLLRLPKFSGDNAWIPWRTFVKSWFKLDTNWMCQNFSIVVILFIIIGFVHQYIVHCPLSLNIPGKMHTKMSNIIDICEKIKPTHFFSHMNKTRMTTFTKAHKLNNINCDTYYLILKLHNI